jgi:hypothetical protein
MPPVSTKNGAFSVKAYRGDCKTLLAFNLDKKSTKNLAGFTIQCQPTGADAYFIQNTLQFEKPADHAQDARLPTNASINAPIHKFRWVHVPGSVHQGTKPVLGPYIYTVTPRVNPSSTPFFSNVFTSMVTEALRPASSACSD